jgi:hypothetical protein
VLIARVMAFALLASASACGNSSVTFDKEKWASGKGNFEGKNPRISMVSDAEEAGVKIGVTRASVRALLGEPDGTGPRGDSWHLGKSGHAPDYETLKVKYDENEIVIKVFILST